MHAPSSSPGAARFLEKMPLPQARKYSGNRVRRVVKGEKGSKLVCFRGAAKYTDSDPLSCFYFATLPLRLIAFENISAPVLFYFFSDGQLLTGTKSYRPTPWTIMNLHGRSSTPATRWGVPDATEQVCPG